MTRLRRRLTPLLTIHLVQPGSCQSLQHYCTGPFTCIITNYFWHSQVLRFPVLSVYLANTFVLPLYSLMFCLSYPLCKLLRQEGFFWARWSPTIREGMNLGHFSQPVWRVIVAANYWFTFVASGFCLLLMFGHWQVALFVSTSSLHSIYSFLRFLVLQNYAFPCGCSINITQ